MPRFTDDNLYSPTLPERYEPALDTLAAFMRAVSVARDEPSPENQAAVRTQHAELMTLGLALLPPADHADEDAARAAFVSGALRAVRYEETVHHTDLPLVDTAGSLTLEGFSSDLADHDEEAVRAALDLAFSPSAELVANIEARMGEEQTQLDRRHQLMHVLDRMFPLAPGADNRASIVGLFELFYPEHPLRPDELEVIRTGTALFFCLPFDGPDLTTRSPDDPDAEAVRAFVHRLTRFHPSQSAHFPSFGSFHREDVRPELTAALSAASGLAQDEIADILPTMLVILPADKLDQYIVHDAWGHGWQALLFRFEETYQRTAGYNRLPPLDKTFTCTRGEHETVDTSMREVLLEQVERVRRGAPIDLAGWEGLLRAASAERLYDALGGLNAEVLADVVEFKYLARNPEHRDLMPSSSFVKMFPTKLDLTLLDLPDYYERAAKGFVRFGQNEDAERAILEAVCLDGDVDRAAAAVVIDAFAEATVPWISRVHGVRIQETDEVGEDAVRVNTFSRVALSYLGLHALFNDLYARMQIEDPDVSFADLLVFSSAAFLEEDWARRFWHLDEFLVHFETLYAQFSAALDDVSGM